MKRARWYMRRRWFPRTFAEYMATPAKIGQRDRMLAMRDESDQGSLTVMDNLRVVRPGIRHAAARNIAWAAFSATIVPTLAIAVAPRLFSMTDWVITVIAGLVYGTAVRIYLRRTGGDLFPGRKEGD